MWDFRPIRLDSHGRTSEERWSGEGDEVYEKDSRYGGEEEEVAMESGPEAHSKLGESW